MASNFDHIPAGGARATEVSQRAVFLAALMPGALAIAITRVFELSGVAFVFVGVVVPAACMLIYLAANLGGDFFDSTRAQVADNIYFLGFLFFLVSLSGTLLLFAVSDKIDQRVVVEGFGIALVTTILGLFLRILVLQQSAPFEEARERAERDLLDAILEFRTRISAANETLHQAQETAISGLAETSKLLVQKVAATTDEINHKLVTAAASIEERMRQVDIPSDMVTRAFQPVIDDFGRAVGELSQSSRAQAEAGRELANKVRSLSTPIEGAASAVASLNAAAESARPSVGAIADAMNAAAAGSAEIAKSTEAARGSAQALSTVLSKVQDVVSSMQLETSIERAVAELAATQQQLGALRTLAAEIVPAVRQNLGGLPAFVDKLDTLSTDLQKAAAAVQALVAGVERANGPETIRKAMEAADSVLRNLRELQNVMASQAVRDRTAVQGANPPQATPGTEQPQEPKPAAGSPATQSARPPSILDRWFRRK
ncbi:MAG: hypothetical protein A3G81_02210 [Betaproteobacteria bacterium RIFCSPLOWO2_12_FULL_65_14]|nr:MAG: hypothetical protein A3G81_02210 [Betaproteobacteria bacterium RIFCSPLOWO2_12_FULL_65_14]